jgi:opacity protein-like surface antigen
MQRKPIFLVTVLLILHSIPCFSSASVTIPWWYHPFITVSGGWSTAQVGKTQTLTMNGDFTTYQYYKNGSNSNRGMGGAFLGTEIPLRPQWDLQAGLGFYQPASFSTGNSILIQGVDAPSSNQYIYSYKVKSSQLLAEGKLLWRVKEFFHPYATFGLGVAFNDSSNYTTNVPPFVTFTPQFTNHINAAFSYSVGLGMDLDVYKKWRVGAGYRFTDLGKANLGLGPLDVTPFTSSLSQSHLYAQEVVAQLSYFLS